VSWAGPYPVLCRKRPTADLVSRKVLVPLLGQIAICIGIQALAYSTVRKQAWYVNAAAATIVFGITDLAILYRYIPPRLNHERSNVKNSENTALFLVSCFEYILSGVVLNAGRPFRQRATQNCEPPEHPLV